MEEKNNSVKEIWDKIEKSNKFLLTLHPYPDGDSLGSCSAMKRLLQDKGKQVDLISRDPIDENFHDLDFTKEVDFSKGVEEIDDSNYDCIMFLDHGNFGEYYYNKETVDKLSGDSRVINIDHHSSNPYFGELNYVEPGAISNCTVLLKLFRLMGEEIDADLAERLLVGIVTDSRFFSFGDSERLFSDVSFLCGRGADFKGKILRTLKENIPYKMKKLEGETLGNFDVKEINGKKIAYSYIRKEFIEKYQLSMAEIRRGIANLRDVGGTTIYFTLSEVEKGLKGSLRVKSGFEGDVDVLEIAKELGGGGHRKAAAFIIEDYSNIEEALERVFEAISKHL
ncbi:MAG: bifunctional oligoribonuclease/PAP phosphatase NrnA [Candidatus Pacearchaeota archaeon]